MCDTALFIAAKKQDSLVTDKCGIYTMNYYSALEMKGPAVYDTVDERGEHYAK